MPSYRPEIDGLRAIAILSVMLFHAGGAAFPGGFVGVDIFFVISGFLITSIIKSKIDNNAFSFADFYARRARRILPALFLMLTVTTLIFSLILTPLEMKSYGTLLRGTVLFTANFFLAGEPGYFDARMQDNPLLHVWSLAVEEQFYILWPPILLLLYKFNNGHRARIAIAVLAGVSFALSLYGVWKGPRFAFYHLPPRGFELIAGGVLALGILPEVWSRKSAEIASFLGLTLLVAPVFAYTKQTPFPGVAALPPVLGCTLVIWAETSFGTRVGAVLKWRPFIFIGLLSYSLYLWHWPILCLLRSLLFRNLTDVEAATALLVTFAISALSWKFAEQPFRRHVSAKPSRSERPSRVRRQAAIAVSLAAALFTAGSIAHNDGLPWRWPQADLDRFSPQSPVSGTIEHPVETIAYTKNGGTLYEIRPANAQRNEMGSFFLWGDSHVGNYAPALRSILGQGTIFWFGGCVPVLNVTWFVNSPKPRTPGCSEARQTVIEAIQTRRPRLVVLASRWIIYGVDKTLGGVLKEHQNDFSDQELSRKLFTENLQKTLKLLTATGAKVLIMAETPEVGIDVPKCLAIASRFNFGDGRCSFVSRKAVEERLAFVNTALAKLSAENPDVHVFWPLDSLCDTEVCYVTRSGSVYFSDSNHLAWEGSMAMAAGLAKSLQQIGITSPGHSGKTASK